MAKNKILKRSLDGVVLCAAESITPFTLVKTYVGEVDAFKIVGDPYDVEEYYLSNEDYDTDDIPGNAPIDVGKHSKYKYNEGVFSDNNEEE